MLLINHNRVVSFITIFQFCDLGNCVFRECLNFAINILQIKDFAEANTTVFMQIGIHEKRTGEKPGENS